MKSLREIPETVSVMVNVNKKRNNVILGGKQCGCFWGKPYITDKIGEISYQISPLSFFQVNPYQTGRLMERHWNTQTLPVMKPYGIFTAESEPFPCSWHRRRRW